MFEFTEKKKHLVLLGDSIFDNVNYVPDGLPVIEHLRQAMPLDWQATLLAVDGAITKEVNNQTSRLPETATHLIVSVGGNDAIRCIPMLSERVHDIADALNRMHRVRTEFHHNYIRMLNHVRSFNLPVAVCTIYNAVPGLGAKEKAALALFNEVIFEEASAAGIPVIDLRLICNREMDFSEVSPIEPSHAGGIKIAQAIAYLIGTHDFTSRHCTVMASIAPKQRRIFASPEMRIKRRNEVTKYIEVLTPNDSSVTIDVIELASGHFVRRGHDELHPGEEGFLWGDEFEATFVRDNLYDFVRMVEPAKVVHLSWELGLFAPSSSDEDWMRTSKSFDDGYNFAELKDYVISLNGAFEQTEFIQFVSIAVHIPVEHEAAFLAFLPELSPALMREKLEYLEVDFSINNTESLIRSYQKPKIEAV
jgi:lysophospholipase L1-like esterase